MDVAIADGDLEAVKSIVQGGGLVDEFVDGWAPLHLATYHGMVEITEYLVNEAKADVNVQLTMGATALFIACEYNKPEMLKILHKAGADPDLFTPGSPPILKAAEEGHTECVKYLVDEMKANMDAGQKDGATAFFMAAQCNHVEIVEYMLSKGVDADKGKLDSATPAIVAAELGNTEVIRAMANTPNVKSLDTQMYNGVTPLYKACEHGHLEIVKLLCESGRVDPDRAKNDGVSPLFTASQMGYLDIIKYLAEEQNADINKPKNDGVYPVYMAAEYRNTDIVQYLVDRGANLSLQSMSGLSALHAAAIQREPETIRILVKGGANVNLLDTGGFPPLCNASEHGNTGGITQLLKSNADPNIGGWNGNIGLHIAAWKGYNDIVKQFLKSETPVDVNQLNAYKYSPLHLAALGGHSDVVKTLLKHGANVNCQNCLGNTPLHAAVEGDNDSCIDLIAKHRDLDGRIVNLLDMNACDLFHSMNPNRAHDALKALEDKLAPTNVVEIISAAKFVTVAQPIMNHVSLKNVKLVRKRHYLQAGEMPHYDVCEGSDWHCTAEDVSLKDKVLFISHRWGSIEHPDPTGEQYRIAVDFLETKGYDIEFIWADYSCICQDRSSELFGIHLQNIPTAVWTATHCLIIPQLIPSPYNNDPDIKVPTTHLTDYLGRAWCLLEAMAAMLTGSTCYLAFQVGSAMSHERFDRPEGAASHLGFFMSYVKVWNRLFAEQQNDMMNVNLNDLEDQWRSKEPCAILGLLIRISKSQDRKVQAMLQLALSLGIQVRDLDRNIPEINELWDNMGQCSVPEDKMVVLNLMLFIGYYSMNMANSDKLEMLSNEEIVVALDEIAPIGVQKNENLSPPQAQKNEQAAPPALVNESPEVVTSKGCKCMVM